MKRGAKYDRSFFLEQRDESRRAAREVIPVLFAMFRPTSVIDVGCGVGTWLTVFNELGVDDFQGVDGTHVDRSLLEIPDSRFHAVDLNSDFAPTFQRRFELAMSLEVAEHLEPSSSKRFVQSLTSLSDVVLFSAAIPAQGGTGHINEQWLEFWAILFREAGYVPVDCLRPIIWNNDQIVWWYRQNMIVFVQENQVERIFPSFDSESSISRPLSLIHPEFLVWAENRHKWFGNTYHRDVAEYRRLVNIHRDGPGE
jgi:SAM-dependent methyltransferase